VGLIAGLDTEDRGKSTVKATALKYAVIRIGIEHPGQGIPRFLWKRKAFTRIHYLESDESSPYLVRLTVRSVWAVP
jgi:hypothetical protein